MMKPGAMITLAQTKFSKVAPFISGGTLNDTTNNRTATMAMNSQLGRRISVRVLLRNAITVMIRVQSAIAAINVSFWFNPCCVKQLPPCFGHGLSHSYLRRDGD